MKIIIAEDEVITARYFSIQAKRNGFEVLCVTHSGEDTVEKAISMEPDLIFMDIAMETRHAGIEACRQIKETGKHIKIVFVSAYHKGIFEDKLRDIPHDGFIDKMYFDKEIKKIKS